MDDTGIVTLRHSRPDGRIASTFAAFRPAGRARRRLGPAEVRRGGPLGLRRCAGRGL